MEIKNMKFMANWLVEHELIIDNISLAVICLIFVAMIHLFSVIVN